MTPTAERRRLWIMAAIVLAASIGFLAVMEARYRHLAWRGIYFKRGHSDNMVQTLPIVQLRRTPLRSLWYLHINPPVLDAIRALIARIHHRVPDEELLSAVDRTLNHAWLIVYGLLAALVALWVGKATRPGFGLASGLLWAAHPAPIFFSGMLEATLLSTLLTLWLLYEIGRLREPHDPWLWRLAAAVLAVYFTRQTYQWHFLPVMAISLVLARVPWRLIARFLVLTGLPIGAFLVKQVLLFGTLSTSSFAGFHYCGVIWYRPSPEEMRAIERELDFHYPAAADRYNGGDPANSRIQATKNLVLAEACRRQIARDPLGSARQVLRSLRQNLKSYLRPSSTDQAPLGNVIVDHLPWRRPFDLLFSGWRLAALLGAALALWLLRARASPRGLREELRFGGGFALPVLYIFTVSVLANRYIWTESVRYKFLLEPALFVFVATQLFLALSPAQPLPNVAARDRWR